VDEDEKPQLPGEEMKPVAATRLKQSVKKLSDDETSRAASDETSRVVRRSKRLAE
jgi:hypothetical protein